MDKKSLIGESFLSLMAALNRAGRGIRPYVESKHQGGRHKPRGWRAKRKKARKRAKASRKINRMYG
jgi:hypothetical protein